MARTRRAMTLINTKPSRPTERNVHEDICIRRRASIHTGYPIAKAMGKRLFNWMVDHSDEWPHSFRDTAEYLQQQFGQTEDIELLLTAIDETISEGQKSSPRSVEAILLCNCYKPTLITAIRIWFAEIRANEARDYALFAEHIVAPEDCIITFNYDVSLEPHLKRFGKWRLGDGYGFIMERFVGGSPVRILKLHGSVNWRFPVGSNSRPLMDSTEIAFLGYSDMFDPRYQDPIADADGTMILPARCKQFLWIQVLDQCTRTSGIIFGAKHELPFIRAKRS